MSDIIAAAVFSRPTLTRLPGSYMHLTYGDKSVVDWIFKLGERGYLAAAAGRMNEELLVAHYARGIDPARQRQIQDARHARMQAQKLASLRLRIMALDARRASCEECNGSVARLLSMCLVCRRHVCTHCRVKGYLQCWRCRVETGREYLQAAPCVDSRLPGDQCTSCYSPEPLGQCMWCNRWLCEMCCRTEHPVACVTCPAKVENKICLKEAGYGKV